MKMKIFLVGKNSEGTFEKSEKQHYIMASHLSQNDALWETKWGKSLTFTFPQFLILEINNMWNDRGKWVTCWQFLILIFLINYLSILNATFWSKSHRNQIWLQEYK